MPLSELSSKILKEHDADFVARNLQDGDEVVFATHTPFEGVPFEREFSGEGRAYQIKRDGDKVQIYCEPDYPALGSMVVLVKDFPEAGLASGSSGEVVRRTANNRFEIAFPDPADPIRYKSVRTNLSDCSFVIDPEYRFLYFGAVSHMKNKYAVEGANYETSGHFADSASACVYAVRFKGAPTKEIVEAAWEQFRKDKPGYAKLESEGKIAVLLMNELPRGADKSETSADCYRRPRRGFHELRAEFLPSSKKTAKPS